MARQVAITITTAENNVTVIDSNGSDRYAEFTTGQNSWWIEWQGDGQARASLQFVGGKIGAIAFSDISTASIDGVDQISAGVQAQDLQELFAALGPYVFIRGAAPGQLPTGASTAAKQDTQTTAINALGTKLDTVITHLAALAGTIDTGRILVTDQH